MLTFLKNRIHELNAKRELIKYAPLLEEHSQNLKAEQLVELIYSPEWERFFWIKQLKEEIKALTQVVEQAKPKVIVEIGTNMGGSLFLFIKVSDPHSLTISIDLPGGKGGGGYPSYRKPFYESFCKPTQQLHLIQADSHNAETLFLLENILQGQKIDFLFIDGDHSYQGVKQDFDMYAPLVKQGGLIGFHDTKYTEPDNWKQVDKFWNQIKSNYQHQEFLSDERLWGGIGVLYQV
ncbi:MAG: class I SAM-dependent methyltransferase [Microscillaceae bacterium]|nr:class I SAM-dependent methyltransferase [Microscillaceae bacterium]